MSFRQLKASVRQIVHSTFGEPNCTYTFAGDLPVTCTIRFHQQSQFNGDPIEDFSPGRFSDFKTVIIDTKQIPNPRKNALILIQTPGLPSIELILDVEITRDEDFVTFSVKEKK